MRRSNPAARVLSVCSLLVSVALLCGCEGEPYPAYVEITVTPEIQKHEQDIAISATGAATVKFPVAYESIDWDSLQTVSQFTVTVPGYDPFVVSGTCIGVEEQGILEHRTRLSSTRPCRSTRACRS